MDFEAQSLHYLVITAKDGTLEARSATATATVLVQDTEDEVPTFPVEIYEATVPENLPDYIVTTVTVITYP